LPNPVLALYDEVHDNFRNAITSNLQTAQKVIDGDDEAMGFSSLDTGLLDVDRIGGYEHLIERIKGIL
jgi:hypothetical protein